MQRLGLIFVCLSALGGCAAAADIADGAPPDVPGPPYQIARAHIREDFDNLLLIERAVGVVIDINHGLASLRGERIPEVRGSGTMQVTQDGNSFNAGTVVLEQGSEVRATDSIELLGSREVRVVGRLVVGPGGITIAAGEAVHVDGEIDSLGPVRILLADQTGTINITGSVIGHGPSNPATPAVSIASRGTVQITGKVVTLADQGVRGGDLLVGAYGAIEVQGQGELGAQASGGASPGFVRLRSETAVRFLSGGHVGSALRPTGAAASSAGEFPGDVEIDAPLIDVSEGSFVAGSTGDGKGSSILLTATEQLRMGTGAKVVAGRGSIGGSVRVHALEAELGQEASISGGLGFTAAGALSLRVTNGLTLRALSALSGGDGECADGGPAEVLVGGHLLAEPTAKVRGGFGGICGGRISATGAVSVRARSGEVASDLVQAGPGVVLDTQASDVVVAAPLGAFVLTGSIESVTVSRGEAAVGKVPRLLDLGMDVPVGTRVSLLLAGASAPEGPFDRWLDVNGSNAQLLDELATARYFRYRVQMEGRSVDTPILDYFDIDLEPNN